MIQKREISESMLEFNLKHIPLLAISSDTKKILSKSLNKEMLIENEKGQKRDWRGLMKLLKIENFHIDVSQSSDEMSKIFDIITQSASKQEISIEKFLKSLKKIDRYDVFDDVFNSFVNDAKNYILTKLKEEKEDEKRRIEEEERVQSSKESSKQIEENEDIEDSDNDELEHYDAYILYNDNLKDSKFAEELDSKLTKKGYTFFSENKDLLPNSAVVKQHDILTIIEQRCNYLIVVFSKDFIKDNIDIFLTDSALITSMQENKSKIIPCLIEECQLPVLLQHCCTLKFYDKNLNVNCWEKLEKALKKERISRNKQHKNSFDVNNMMRTAPSSPSTLQNGSQNGGVSSTNATKEKKDKEYKSLYKKGKRKLSKAIARFF